MEEQQQPGSCSNLRNRANQLLVQLAANRPRRALDVDAARGLLEAIATPSSHEKLIDALTRSAWEWGASCEVDGVRWGEAGDSHNQMWRDRTTEASTQLLAAIIAQSVPATKGASQVEQVMPTIESVKPCPFCRQAPKVSERWKNAEGTEFFCAVACYCGGYSACAHKMAVRPTPEAARAAAIEAWNARHEEPADQGALPIEEVYGSTELPYEVVGVPMTDGDRRLMRLLIMALGNDHPAFDDFMALLWAKGLVRPPAGG